MQNIKKNTILLLLTVLSYSANATNYVELERLAAKKLCVAEPSKCVEFIEPSAVVSGPFKVDGKPLPLDALKDVQQQRAMLPAGLYVKEDGSVSQLTEITRADIKDVGKVDNKLPVKNWATPPKVSGSERVIITTGQQP